MVSSPLNHLGFSLRISEIRNGIFIPRYYNPEILKQLMNLQTTHELISLGDMKQGRYLTFETGHEIGKMAYGTGEIPFIRTSDIVNWEIKTDPKQGVGTDIYAQYSSQQDVKAGDIFFVRDGTYLIGQTCLVSEQDLPCLYQSHILKLRLKDSTSILPPLLLACLNTPIVKKQIRAKQFTADIIDTIGNRYLELVIPIPKEQTFRDRITKEVETNLSRRAQLREFIRKIPLWAEGYLRSLEDPIPENWAWRIEHLGNPGFLYPVSAISQNCFIPKYYNPEIRETLKTLSTSHELTSLQDMVKRKIVSWETGIEIGKMAYGTGLIPFIRTSDISNWELKGDPKQTVSEEIYEENKQDLQKDDIFVVRDGTYLVGTSCILTEHDTKILFCGGIYKLRVQEKKVLDPFLLLTLLNTPIVRRQMRAKQFTRDIIDTLGKRLFEVILPIPKDDTLRQKIAEETRRAIETRVQLRNRSKEIALEVEGIKQI